RAQAGRGGLPGQAVRAEAAFEHGAGIADELLRGRALGMARSAPAKLDAATAPSLRSRRAAIWLHAAREDARWRTARGRTFWRPRFPICSRLGRRWQRTSMPSFTSTSPESRAVPGRWI